MTVHYATKWWTTFDLVSEGTGVPPGTVSVWDYAVNRAVTLCGITGDSFEDDDWIEPNPCSPLIDGIVKEDWEAHSGRTVDCPTCLMLHLVESADQNEDATDS